MICTANNFMALESFADLLVHARAIGHQANVVSEVVHRVFGSIKDPSD
jgi:hypothetical protein